MSHPDPQLQEEYGLFIDGEWRPASDGATFTSTCPADGERLATCAEATKDDVDRAVDAAWAAFVYACFGRRYRHALEDFFIYDGLNPFPFLRRKRGEMGEVETKPRVGYVRTGLLHMAAQHFAQRFLQKMGGRMVAHCRGAFCFVVSDRYPVAYA